MSLHVFWVSTLLFSALMTLVVLKSYPGGVMPDTIEQWHQVQSLTFDNWHPVFHTLLMWLVSRICNSYSFVVIVQVLLFCVSLGYLFSTMAAWGLSKRGLSLIFLVLIINPTTQSLMIYLLKDSAMSISVAVLTAMGIHIYYSNGAWLSSWKHIISIALVLTVATMVRHNGFFFTVPFALLLLVQYRKQVRGRLVLPLFALLFLLIRFPLYSALDVTYPDNTLQESVGIPMTILSDVFWEEAGLLSEPTEEFLLRIAPEELWEVMHTYGNYNSLKWASSVAGEVIRETPPAQLLEMTLEAIQKAPYRSFLAVTQLTAAVWDSNGLELFELGPYIYANDFSGNSNMELNELGSQLLEPLDVVLDFFPPEVLYSIGFHILCLLVCFIVALPQAGFRSLLLVLPSLAYNFGTMLLLAGDDYRFFHFNLLITYPTCLLLLSQRRASENAPSQPPLPSAP